MVDLSPSWLTCAMSILAHTYCDGVALGGIVAIAACHASMYIFTLWSRVYSGEVDMVTARNVSLPSSSSDSDELVDSNRSRYLYSSSSLGGSPSPIAVLPDLELALRMFVCCVLMRAALVLVLLGALALFGVSLLVYLLSPATHLVPCFCTLDIVGS